MCLIRRCVHLRPLGYALGISNLREVATKDLGGVYSTGPLHYWATLCSATRLEQMNALVCLMMR